LAYDYQIQRDDDDPADVDVIFACRCGAKSCRGSMLEAPKKKRKSTSKRKSSAKRTSGTKRASSGKRKPENKRRRAHERKAVRKLAR